jgi:hypothetical protein
MERSDPLLVELRRLEASGDRNAALDLLYDRVDELMRTGQFEALDSLLQQVRLGDMSIDVLLGLLTATLPARSRLPSRQAFFRETENALREWGEYEDGLLTGLE